MKNDTVVIRLLQKFLRYRRFRILLTYLYPVLAKLGIIGLLHKINRGSFSDPYNIYNWPQDDILRINEIDVTKSGPVEQYLIDFSKMYVKDKPYTFAFLLRPNHHDIYNIEKACHLLEVKPLIFDINNPLLFKQLPDKKFDGLFIMPDYSSNVMRCIFHETAHLLNSETKIKIYPTLKELDIYESKRALYNFLIINNISHPETYIFYDLENAMAYLETAGYPLIFKTHIGAAASGVEILHTKNEALKLAKQLFNKYYLRKMELDRRYSDWGYMIVQKYIDQVKEYRIIKTGDSWFGFQKWKKPGQDFLSGSGTVLLEAPPPQMFDYCRNLADRFSFTSIAFDIFEDLKGNYLVNELQTWFGSYHPAELFVNGVPGRFRFVDNRWTFEPGFFNVYGSYPLKIIDFITNLKNDVS